MQMSEKLKYTWKDFENDTITLIRNIIRNTDKKINKKIHIVTLYRGGLPFGVSLSNKLNAPLSIIDFQSYDGNTKTPIFIKNAGISVDEHIFLVDDIFDKGLTIAKAKEFIHKEYPYTKITCVVLHINDANKHLHNHYDFDVISANTTGGKWVEYPWE